MKVVHVADFSVPQLGYQELLLAVWSAKQGNEVHLVTSNRNPPAPDYQASFGSLLGPRELPAGISEHRGVTIHRLPVLAEVRTRVLLKGLASTIRELAPDAIFGHGTMSPTALTVTHAGAGMDVPVFLDNHMLFSVMDASAGGRAAYGLSKQVMRRYLAPRVEKFYGVAKECCDFLVEAQGAPAVKVDLLPLGIDTEIFSYQEEGRANVRHRWDVPLDAVVVGQTGKLDRSKDPRTLAFAAARVMASDERVFAVFVGSGPAEELERIREPFESHGVAERFRQVPPVPVGELADVFSAMDIVVYPGATSMSSLEAAACGRAVVMNDLPASQWRAELGVGLSFPLGDAAALRDQLASLIEDEDTRRTLGRKAQGAVLGQFSYDKVAGQLGADMATAVARRKRPR